MLLLLNLTFIRSCRRLILSGILAFLTSVNYCCLFLWDLFVNLLENFLFLLNTIVAKAHVLGRFLWINTWTSWVVGRSPPWNRSLCWWPSWRHLNCCFVIVGHSSSWSWTFGDLFSNTSLQNLLNVLIWALNPSLYFMNRWIDWGKALLGFLLFNFWYSGLLLLLKYTVEKLLAKAVDRSVFFNFQALIDRISLSSPCRILVWRSVWRSTNPLARLFLLCSSVFIWVVPLLTNSLNDFWADISLCRRFWYFLHFLVGVKMRLKLIF